MKKNCPCLMNIHINFHSLKIIIIVIPAVQSIKKWNEWPCMPLSTYFKIYLLNFWFLLDYFQDGTLEWSLHWYQTFDVILHWHILPVQRRRTERPNKLSRQWNWAPKNTANFKNWYRQTQRMTSKIAV